MHRGDLILLAEEPPRTLRRRPIKRKTMWGSQSWLQPPFRRLFGGRNLIFQSCRASRFACQRRSRGTQ